MFKLDCKILKGIKNLSKNTAEVTSKISTAIKASGNGFSSFITKIYLRRNGILDVKIDGYGRIRIKEAKILEDSDQIYKDRYDKWIKGKLSERTGNLIRK